MNYFKKRYQSMKKDAEEFAKSKNVTLQMYSFFQVFTWVIIASSILSVFTFMLIGRIQVPPGYNTLVNVLINLVIPTWCFVLLFGFGKYFFYVRILEIHYINKLMTYAINKLDMYWWRKYRKQSPLTETLHKMQTKASSTKGKLSKRQKRLIGILFIMLLVCFYGYQKYDTFVSVAQSFDDTQKADQIQSKNLGKIFDGMNGKLENHT